MSSFSAQPYTGRLAPAPTGALHLGNARTFLIAWLRARAAGGRLVLRLEDLDHPKVKPWAAEQAYRDLAWLGVEWDNGPANACPPYGSLVPGDPLVQSQRLDVYASMLAQLRDEGLIYPCICTRKDIESLRSAPNAGEDVRELRYPGVCRNRFASYEAAAEAAGGSDVAWRFRVREGCVTSFVDGFAGAQTGVLSEWSGDFPVARGWRAGYQLAVVVDDHAQSVTEVVRGDDLLPSTHRQLALYQALGWRPPAFFHVPLVVGEDGRRLAKRHGDTRLSLLREAGQGPERVLGWLAARCGWCETPRPMSMQELCSLAGPARIAKDRIVFTAEDAHWLGFPHERGNA